MRRFVISVLAVTLSASPLFAADSTPLHPGKPAGVLEAIAERTPSGRLVTMRELSEAALFLLENGAVNGVNLAADGGWTLK